MFSAPGPSAEQQQLEAQQASELQQEQAQEAAKQKQVETQRIGMLKSRFGMADTSATTAPQTSTAQASATFNQMTGNR